MASAERDPLPTRLRGGLDERLRAMAPSRRLRSALAEEVIAEFAAGRPISLLDAGAGDGLLSVAIAKRHPDWRLVGMDLLENLLSAARARARAKRVENVTYAQADLTQPLPEGDFDAVMAIECLSEIPDDAKAVRMLADALRPGGMLVLQVPDERWRPILPGSSDVWRHAVRHGYTTDGLTAMLRDAGLEQIEIRPTFRTAVAAAQEIRERTKASSLAIRLAVFPILALALTLERHGLGWGPSNAIFVTARRPQPAQS